MKKKTISLFLIGLLCTCLLAGCGSPEKTIEKIEMEISVQDRTEEDWTKLAEAYLALGDATNARFTLIEAVALYPDSEVLQQLLQENLLAAPAPDHVPGSYDGALRLTFPTEGYKSGQFYITVDQDVSFQELEEDSCLADDGITIEDCSTSDLTVDLYLPGEHIVRAYVVERDAVQSQVFEGTYLITGADFSDFGFSPADGRHESPLSVSFNGTNGSTVYYTLDGTDPLLVNADGASLGNGTKLEGKTLTLYTGRSTIVARCITDSGLISPLIHTSYDVYEPAPVIEEPEYDDYYDDDIVFEGEKPVIYLYPQTETQVSVQLDLNGQLTCTYPAYRNGWTVTASPDGTLTDKDGKLYNYLYWEGTLDADYDFSRGFCVKGSDTAVFLEKALAKLGLTPREANEFIIYWLPQMQNNPYNLISFQNTAYTDQAKLNIQPEPDTLLRVFMVFKSLDKPVTIQPQILTAPIRTGFTVVEWGGTNLDRPIAHIQ